MGESVLRVSVALHCVLERTARHTGLTISEIIRAVNAGIRRKRNVTQRKIKKGVTDSGPVLIHVKKCRIENPAKFRRILFLRCLEELEKPCRGAPPQFQEVAGIDYYIESCNQEEL